MTTLAEVLPAEALTATDAAGVPAALRSAAEAVVHPCSTEEVAATMRWAAASGVGVLPLASGDRVRMPAPAGRFVVLGTDRLGGFEIYEPADVTFTARAGTRMSEVADRLGAHRQWLPFDPPGQPERTLGGLVATGESGPVATGYGQLRNHVLGATVVCGDGRVLRLGGRVVKNVAGFDLLRPVVGSRGRLGVITSVCLRAFPMPTADRLFVFRADDLAGLADVAGSVRTAPIVPASVVAWAPADAAGGAALAVRLHGAASSVEAERAKLERHAGVGFEEPTDAPSLATTLRDHASAGRVRIDLSLLPSRLFEGLAVASVHLGAPASAADVYAGTARLVVDAADASVVTALRTDVETLGGALTVVSGDGIERGEAVADPSSRPSAEERELAAGLEELFDPRGVLWPCRT
jgi:glycolate oxidase FAD binding subunit